MDEDINNRTFDGNSFKTPKMKTKTFSLRKIKSSYNYSNINTEPFSSSKKPLNSKTHLNLPHKFLTRHYSVKQFHTEANKKFTNKTLDINNNNSNNNYIKKKDKYKNLNIEIDKYNFRNNQSNKISNTDNNKSNENKKLINNKIDKKENINQKSKPKKIFEKKNSKNELRTNKKDGKAKLLNYNSNEKKEKLINENKKYKNEDCTKIKKEKINKSINIQKDENKYINNKGINKKEKNITKNENKIIDINRKKEDQLTNKQNIENKNGKKIKDLKILNNKETIKNNQKVYNTIETESDIKKGENNIQIKNSHLNINSFNIIPVPLEKLISPKNNNHINLSFNEKIKDTKLSPKMKKTISYGKINTKEKEKIETKLNEKGKKEENLTKLSKRDKEKINKKILTPRKIDIKENRRNSININNNNNFNSAKSNIKTKKQEFLYVPHIVLDPLDVLNNQIEIILSRFEEKNKKFK